MQTNLQSPSRTRSGVYFGFSNNSKMFPSSRWLFFRCSSRNVFDLPILANSSSASGIPICCAKNVSKSKESRLTFYENNMRINKPGFPMVARDRILEFSKRIGFPVQDCVFFKQALTVNPDPDDQSWNTDLGRIGEDALRLALAKYFSELRYYKQARSECLAAANRVLKIPSLFRHFAQYTKLQKYLILDDKRSWNEVLDHQKSGKDCSQIEKLEVPLSEVNEELLHKVSLSVAGAIYLDSADTAEVRSIFFPFLVAVLEKEKRATMVRLGINYEDTTPEAFRREMMKSYLEPYGDIHDIDGLLEALK